MGYSIDILNNIRLNSSEEYQNRVPVASRENLSAIGYALQTYTLLANEFNTNLYNKIGKTIIDQQMFTNKLARFKSGGIVSPHDVEEIFMEMAKAEGAFDPQGKNPLGRRPDIPVHVIYHRQNRQDKYVISIGDLDFVRVFRSEATLDQFIKGKINAVYSADARDEYLYMKNLLATYPNKDGSGLGYFDYEVAELADKSDFAKGFVKTLRKAVLDLTTEIDTKYNVAGVERKSEVKNLALFVHKDVVAEVDVELLAKAFHQSNTDMNVVPTIIVMGDFGSLTDTYALLVEEDWFRVWDTLMHMEPQRNADGLFTNYFYHHHQILSASLFKNAVRFKKVMPAAAEAAEAAEE